MKTANYHQPESKNTIPPTPREKYLELGLLLFMIFLAGGGYVYIAAEGFRSLFSYCILHETTGLLCPACGGTRAMSKLLSGNLVMALRYHPLVVVLLPLFFYALTLLARVVMDRNRSLAQMVQVKPFWVWSIFVLVILFFLARNMPFLNYLGYPW